MLKLLQGSTHILLALFFFRGVSAGARAEDPAANDRTEKCSELLQAPDSRPASAAHSFWDKTNLGLFAGVGAVRALDYTSTGHLRSLGRDEILLTNDIVDNKPLFAGIEVAGTAVSVGVAYLLHRASHHKLERWVSIVHIGVGTFGDIRNYSLKRLSPATTFP